MYRDHTKVIKIGNRVIGGGNPILIQSMTNTKTEDVEATVAQILSLEKAGCDIIRCAVPTMEAAKALSQIKKQIHIPLVADIHFDYRLAIAAMENGADKIRINPGNIGSKERIQAVVDTANGTASIIARKMYEMFSNIELIPLYMESDSRFPNHHPDPSVEANNKDLKKAVIENKADIGIGIDGDGDRIGLIDETGSMIYIDFMAIIVWRDIMPKISDKRALFDVKCSKSLADEIIKLGGKPVCYRTGNSYMKAKMREDKFVFGSELSGHVWFNDSWPNIDDGLYAGLRIIEILSKTDKNLSSLLDGVNRYFSTPELIIKSSDDKKFEIVNKIKEYALEKGYSINDIDGVRAEFENGWALVRASNTGPNITARFEGTTEEELQKIKDEFMGVLEKEL